MPVIEVKLEDFNKFIGRELTIKYLEEKLPMLGCAWEGETEESFSIQVDPNRPDMLSIEGLARAFSSFLGLETGLRPYQARESDYRVRIEESILPIRPVLLSAVVKNISFSDDLIRSIIQMQEKLHITHCRNRRKASIGLHNLEPIKFPLTYTAMPKTFRFIPLDEAREMSLQEILRNTPKGVDYGWILEGKEEYPILMDSKGMVLSMPPIINSTHTRIDEDTRDIFIDVTGTDEKTVGEVLNIIVTTFADRGAEIYRVENLYPNRVVETPKLEPWKMSLEQEYVNRLLGLSLNSEEIISYLERMGFSASGKEILEVRVPCYRTDIMHPMDLVEEVAIAYGYDKFQPEIPRISTIGEEDPLEVFSRQLRNFLVGFNLVETITFLLSNKEKLFHRMRLQEEPAAETENPKTEEYCVLRNWLVPSLMEVLQNNRHHPYPQNLFEVGDIIRLDPTDETGARTVKSLAIVLSHSRASLSEIKAVAESILRNLGMGDYVISEGNHSSFIEGRCFEMSHGGELLCFGGEIKPEVLENWSLEMPVTALEMNVDLLLKIVTVH
jgi:phenylalanyl-tRNA synthetase beta chain